MDIPNNSDQKHTNNYHSTSSKIYVTTAIVIRVLCTYTLTIPIARIPMAMSTLTCILRLTNLQVQRYTLALCSRIAVPRVSVRSIGMMRANLLAWPALVFLD